MFSKKKIIIPTGDEKSIKAIESWKVTWNSYSEHSYQSNEQCEFLTSEKEANELATELRKAFKLIKQQMNIEVKVKKNN